MSDSVDIYDFERYSTNNTTPQVKKQDDMNQYDTLVNRVNDISVSKLVSQEHERLASFKEALRSEEARDNAHDKPDRASKKNQQAMEARNRAANKKKIEQLHLKVAKLDSIKSNMLESEIDHKKIYEAKTTTGPAETAQMRVERLLNAEMIEREKAAGNQKVAIKHRNQMDIKLILASKIDFYKNNKEEKARLDERVRDMLKQRHINTDDTLVKKNVQLAKKWPDVYKKNMNITQKNHKKKIRQAEQRRKDQQLREEEETNAKIAALESEKKARTDAKMTSTDKLIRSRSVALLEKRRRHEAVMRKKKQLEKEENLRKSRLPY